MKFALETYLSDPNRRYREIGDCLQRGISTIKRCRALGALGDESLIKMYIRHHRCTRSFAEETLGNDVEGEMFRRGLLS